MTALKPAEMTDDQLQTALRRLATERTNAGALRRGVIGRVVDVVLDEVLVRRGSVTDAEAATTLG